jgi:hypothetical protein
MPLSPTDGPPPAAPRPRVLAVDDDPALRVLMRRWLTHFGCEVETAADGIEEKTLVQLLKYLDIDLARHWKLCEDFLKLLTKSEIEAMCDEIGLKATMGGAFAKAMNGKKDEIIKALLNVAAFPYEGKVPRSMRFNVE